MEDSQTAKILYALRDEFLAKLRTPKYHYDLQGVDLGVQLSDMDSSAFPRISIYPIHGEPAFDAKNNVYSEKLEIVVEGYTPVMGIDVPPVIMASNLLEDIQNVVLRLDKTLGGLAYNVRYSAEDKSEMGMILPDRLNPDVIITVLAFTVFYRHFPAK